MTSHSHPFQGHSTLLNGSTGGILESISNFTNSFTSPIINDNDNEEEDALNVKEPLSSNSSPIIGESFYQNQLKSSSNDPSYLTHLGAVENSDFFQESRPFSDPIERQLFLLSHLATSVEKIQKDLHSINIKISTPSIYSRIMESLCRCSYSIPIYFRVLVCFNLRYWHLDADHFSYGGC